MPNYKTSVFPKSRVATIDVCEIGKQKHHISALLEIDVTTSREKIKSYKKEVGKISFSAWLIKAISYSVESNKMAAAYLKGSRKVVVFDNINVSFLIEKELNGEKVPIPLLIEKANEMSIESLTEKISDSKNEVLSENDLVLHRKTTRLEQVYYYLPGFIRRTFWRSMLKRPNFVFSKMGNVAITSIGMMGKINGWFIPISVHPISFGIGSVIKKPVVIDNEIVVREMLNITVLLDHDIIDGAPMARFIGELTKNIESGIFL